jgi:hypothetical protein
MEETFDPAPGHGRFQLAAECVLPYLCSKMDRCSEPGGYGCAVRPAAADRFLNRIDGCFPIRKQIVTRRKWYGLDVPVDISDHAQRGFLEDEFLHNSMN